MTQGLFHRLVANLLSTPKGASSNPGGKGKKGLLVLRFFPDPEPWVNSTAVSVGTPIFPGFFPSLLVHCRSANRLPRRVEVTSKKIAEGGWALTQEVLCGRGKEHEKICKNGLVLGSSNIG